MTEYEEKILKVIKAASLVVPTSEECPLIDALNDLIDHADYMDYQRFHGNDGIFEMSRDFNREVANLQLKGK